jgi:hypothetical protein
VTGRRWIAFVAAGVASLAILASAAVVLLVRWNGGLGHGYGKGVGIPVRVGQSFSIGMTDLRPNRRVRIEAVRLHGASGRVRLIGAVMSPVGQVAVGTERGFPPHSASAMRPAVGAVVPAHTRMWLVVGLRADARGDFSVRGIDILYRERWRGIELRRRAHTGLEVEGCAVTTAAHIPRCAVPQFSSESEF